MWLWDSCFHSMAWTSLRDARGVVELSQVLRGQFVNGFVPHMVYAGPNDVDRGAVPGVSSFTQPPVYALALAWARQQGLTLPGELPGQVSRALSYFTGRRFRDGLAFVVHPWETGCDDSPRWDSWYGSTTWDAARWLERDKQLVGTTEFDPAAGDAIWNTDFVCAPSLFNAILSDAFIQASECTGQAGQRRAGFELGEAMDELLWDDSQGLYVDQPIVGAGGSHRVPVLDGVLAALGLRYLPAGHPLYTPEGYWRGSAWPQLDFLAVQACRRWGQDDLAAQLADRAKRGIIQSGWAEHRNPETGRGLGARPQTWASLAAAM
jgi:hypothetical protein